MSFPRNLPSAGWILLVTILASAAAEFGASAQLPGITAGPIINPGNGHKYYLLEPASWTNAEAAAVGLGGHLVTINSLDENTWVYNTFSTFGGISRDLWIGFYLPDPAEASTNSYARIAQFQWISGQPVEVRLLTDTNQILSGFCEMIGPADSVQGFEGHWTEQVPSVELNSVAKLPLPLEIVSQPKSVSVGIGAKATFQVFADGTSPLQYQWQSFGTNLPGETKATLVLTNVQPNQLGSFRVEVSNASGSITSAPAFFSVAGIVGWGSTGANDTRTNIPPGLTSVAAISAGTAFDLALKPDGTVVAWGFNETGQLNVPPDLTNAVAIAAGDYHSLALKADGTVVSWGYDVLTGNWVPGGLSNVVAIDTYNYHNIALRRDGTVVAWGGNGAQPSVTPPDLSGVVAIAAGDLNNVALKSDGTVVSWGDVTGQYVAVPPEATNVVAISAGSVDALALKAEGTVVGWGQDWSGQLEIPPGLTNVVAVCAKWMHSLALRSDGTVVAWGSNNGGESTVPPGLPNVVAIAGGSAHSLALLRDGAPNLTVQPWDQFVTAGGASALAAKAVGQQSMAFQWQFNGQPILGATRDSLSLTNVQPSNAGLYALTVSNQVGIVSSRRAKLVVSPVFQLQPVSLGGPIEALNATGPTGRDYILQVSSELTTWKDLQTSASSSMPVQFSVTNSSAAAHRFYRVRLGAVAGPSAER